MEGKFYRIEYRHPKWLSDQWRQMFGEHEQPSPYDDSFGYKSLADAAYNLDTLRLTTLSKGYEFRIVEIAYSIERRVLNQDEYGHLGRVAE